MGNLSVRTTLERVEPQLPQLADLFDPAALILIVVSTEAIAEIDPQAIGRQLSSMESEGVKALLEEYVPDLRILWRDATGRERADRLGDPRDDIVDGHRLRRRELVDHVDDEHGLRGGVPRNGLLR